MVRSQCDMRLAVFAVVAGVGACSLWADFDGLDDARPDAGTAGGAGGASAASGATGATGATAGDGGAGAGGLGGAGATGGAVGPGGAGGGDGGDGGDGDGGDGGAPACKEAVVPCTNKAECCGNLACGDTSAGHVCCGLTGEPCTKPGGEDCCGWFSECEGGSCT